MSSGDPHHILSLYRGASHIRGAAWCRIGSGLGTTHCAVATVRVEELHVLHAETGSQMHGVSSGESDVAQMHSGKATLANDASQ